MAISRLTDVMNVIHLRVVRRWHHAALGEQQARPKLKPPAQSLQYQRERRIDAMHDVEPAEQQVRKQARSEG
jgi:hypothetical protein